MRARLRPLRARAMARRPDGERKLLIPPRARRVAGWLAAIAIVAGIAIGVGLLGGNADGTRVVPTPDATGAAPAATIRFGTALDPATQEVAETAATSRFIETDTFAYSFRPAQPPPRTVWVEVRRGADGSGEAVQEPAPHGLAEDALVIAFEVPAANLFRDFGDGPFQMRIYLEEDGAPAAASGAFELISEASTPSP
ncbi:MAG TPA: hypothetical protein VM253_07150 [Candidatus Limnocylindrales bacterium]|nr:hypothetical protein [Candidatus Limnocylindrales bacterium]